MQEALPRPKLQDLSAEQLQALENRFDPQWPDTWRDFAYSFYCTLVGVAVAGDAAELAVCLVAGVAKDLGGSQPYIPAGYRQSAASRADKAMALLDQGYVYKKVADMCGLSESRIRQLDTARRRPGGREKTPAQPWKPLPNASKEEIRPQGAAHPFRGL